jgi:hypothetical protein
VIAVFSQGANVTTEQWAEFLSKIASIIIGSAPGVGTVIFFLLRVYRKLDVFLVEHEILMSEYARNHGIKIEDLPTRSRHRI